MEVKICAPDIHEKDAVGNFCLDLCSLLNESGQKASLYAQRYTSDEIPVRSMEELFGSLKADDVLIVSYSIYDEYLERYIDLPNKKLFYFHGVTPPELLRTYDPVTADLCTKSYQQLEKVRGFVYYLVNSEFTANCLKQYIKTSKVEIVPPVFEKRFENRVLLHNERINKGNDINLLTVGRVVPHKKIEDIIDIFSEFLEVNPDSNLTIAGDLCNLNYFNLLKTTIQEKAVPNHKITFTGKITDDELFYLYHFSDIYISASEHEGFCIPILEAMLFHLLTVVKKGNAGEEVLGDSGILFNHYDNYPQLANRIYNCILEHNHNSELMKSCSNKAKKALEFNNIDLWKSYLLDEVIYKT